MMDGAPPPPPFEEGSGSASLDAVAACPAAELEIGMFFDGTGNNLANVEIGNALRAAGEPDHPEASYGNDFSNVAKLFQLHADTPREVPNTCGTAKLRRSEIIDGIGTTARAEDSLFGFAAGWGPTGVARRVQDGFRRFLRHVREARDSTASRDLHAIKLDVFGFSRGAAAARHFVNCVHRGHAGEGYGGPFYELQDEDRAVLEVRFIGLFDTVVSWGVVADDDNHGSLRIGLRNDSATKIVHITALDEVRANFPLTEAPSAAETIRAPGAHSDIGGGYPDHWDERPMIVPEETLRQPPPGWSYANGPASTPEDGPLRAAMVAQGWLAPSDRDAIVRTVHFQPGGRSGVPSYTVRRFMHRPWMDHRLSHVALHVMHDRAVRAGVALPGTIPPGPDHDIPAPLVGLADRLIGGARLQLEDSHPYRREYIHHSSHWARSGVVFRPMAPTDDGVRSVYSNPGHEAI